MAEISGLPESRGPLRRLCGDLVRRVRLLSPLLDEIRDGAGDWLPDLVQCLGTVHDALVCAREVLRSVYDGSKIYQVVIFCVKFCMLMIKLKAYYGDLMKGRGKINTEFS